MICAVPATKQVLTPQAFPDLIFAFSCLPRMMFCSSDLHEVGPVRFAGLTEPLCCYFQGSCPGMPPEEERICQMSREPSCCA